MMQSPGAGLLLQQRRNRHCARLAIAAAFCLTSALAASSDEIAAEIFFDAPGQEVRIIADPDDIVVFSATDNALYMLDGRDLRINVATVRLNGDVIISSFSSQAVDMTGAGHAGEPGRDYTKAPNCRNGSPGGEGGAGGIGPVGLTGADAGMVRIAVRTVVGTGTLHIFADGQAGGKAGVGGMGGQGGSGEAGGTSESGIGCNCGGGDGGRGGNGGRGGPGGTGGEGGAGGTVAFHPDSVGARSRIEVSVRGGPGGPGGPGGAGGAAGEGAVGGSGSLFCGGGRGADDGQPGEAGDLGPQGINGANGHVIEF